MSLRIRKVVSIELSRTGVRLRLDNDWSIHLHQRFESLFNCLYRPTVLLGDDRSVMKNKQNSVIKELCQLKMINQDLRNEISNNIEAVFSNESKHKIEEWIEIANLAQLQDQLLVGLDHPDVG